MRRRNFARFTVILPNKSEYILMRKNNEKALESLEFQGYRRLAGMGFEPHDLRVMSPTSYQAALPRDI